MARASVSATAKAYRRRMGCTLRDATRSKKHASAAGATPMIEHIESLFEQLLSSPPTDATFTLETCTRFVSSPSPDGALSAEYDRFLDLLNAAVARMRPSWGEPDFIGSGGDDGFPDWSDAISIALWHRGQRIAYVAFKHPDHGTALTLEAGVHSTEPQQSFCR